MEFIKKYNTHFFILIVIVLTIVDMIYWNQLSITRKLVNIFAIVAALHEIEEKIWPGGFYELMLNKFKIEKEKADLGRATLVVSIYWILLLGIAYVFESYVFILAITITLSIFEAFIHTAGIRIHKLSKPYTPGLVTAWGMAIVGFYSIYVLNALGLANALDYIVGAVLWVLSFICMDAVIISGLGITIPELISTFKENF